MIDERTRIAGLTVLEALLARSAVRRELLRLLASGHSRKAIARIMGKSVHTIDGHLKDLYRAIGYGDRALLILLAAQLDDRIPPLPPRSWGLLKIKQRTNNRFAERAKYRLVA